MITFYTPLVYWKHLAIRSLSPFCLLSPTFNNTVIFSPSRSTRPLILLTAVATLTGPRETINHEWMYTQNLHVQFKCVNECITVHAKFHSDESYVYNHMFSGNCMNHKKNCPRISLSLHQIDTHTQHNY